ncbi:tyrosine-type recombinase/integrase [Candidatus Contendibacter odensensis]|uniref:Integrase family protein n=1 Tax=Candidatus Contendobacter odensis Run_B_J11 TaxID=1400861 RepID=A0A7U7GFL8_9GAMM|nr:site-specific integrase [Candidatus Contendobacter odensis]CDH46996.1 putative Integrase family protein [Candidatus Contendobacter odensis Run_B_J11]
MAYRQKGSPFYWVSLTAPDGRKVRRSTKTSNAREARTIEARWRTELAASASQPARPPITLGTVLKLYLDSSRAKKSHREDVIRSTTLLSHLGDVDAYTLSGSDMQRYVSERGEKVSPSTINRELALLSVAVNRAQVGGYPIPNPVRGHKQREPEGRLDWLTEQEAVALLAGARLSDALYLADWITVALHTGLRHGEINGLRWEDVKNGSVWIDGHRTKSGKRRVLPLTPDALAAIERQPRRAETVFSHEGGRPIRDVRTALARACQRAGIRVITPHLLRHTCASWLAQRGVPLYNIRLWLGHSTLSVTERYAHLAPEHLVDCVAALSSQTKSGLNLPVGLPDNVIPIRKAQ